eukprot:365034-Chlamydomonas_euryale.AAC.7
MSALALEPRAQFCTSHLPRPPSVGAPPPPHPPGMPSTLVWRARSTAADRATKGNSWGRALAPSSGPVAAARHATWIPCTPALNVARLSSCDFSDARAAASGMLLMWAVAARAPAAPVSLPSPTDSPQPPAPRPPMRAFKVANNGGGGLRHERAGVARRRYGRAVQQRAHRARTPLVRGKGLGRTPPYSTEGKAAPCVESRATFGALSRGAGARSRRGRAQFRATRAGEQDFRRSELASLAAGCGLARAGGQLRCLAWHSSDVTAKSVTVQQISRDSCSKPGIDRPESEPGSVVRRAGIGTTCHVAINHVAPPADGRSPTQANQGLVLEQPAGPGSIGHSQAVAACRLRSSSDHVRVTAGQAPGLGSQAGAVTRVASCRS